MNDKYFQYIVNLYFIKIFYYGFMIYIYTYFFSFFNFLNIMTSVYLSKDFNFITAYNSLFRNFNYYKCLSNNASKHLKMMDKHFLKYVFKHK